MSVASSLAAWIIAAAPGVVANHDPTAQLELRWEAPPSCPDATAVRERVARQLASVGARGEPRKLQVEASLDTRSDTATLALRIASAEGEQSRVLVGRSCEEVTDAAVLIVAMTIEPGVIEAWAQGDPPGDRVSATPASAGAAGVPAPEATPAPAPEATHAPAEATVHATAAAAPAAPPSSTSPTQPSRRPGLRAGFDVEGGLGFGPLPGPAGVVAAGLGVRGHAFRVDATAAYWAPRQGGTSSNPQVEVRAQLWHLGARGCGVLRTGRVEVPLCAGVVGGLMHAEGEGSLRPGRARSPWAAATAGAWLVYRARPWLGLRIGAEGHVALARPAFHTEPSGTVHRAGVGGVALRAGLDFEVP